MYGQVVWTLAWWIARHKVEIVGKSFPSSSRIRRLAAVPLTDDPSLNVASSRFHDECSPQPAGVKSCSGFPVLQFQGAGTRNPGPPGWTRLSTNRTCQLEKTEN